MSGKRVYLIDRGGTVHVWDDVIPNHHNPWQRAICGDPGDFNEILDPVSYFGWKKDVITCDRCRQKLNIPTQIELFK
jgi:hypothetical protein